MGANQLAKELSTKEQYYDRDLDIIGYVSGLFKYLTMEANVGIAV